MPVLADSDYTSHNVIGKHCIYAHIPKTGGTSIVNALYECGEIPMVRPDGFGIHCTYGFYPHEFDEFYFTFVRNPFDRIVSSYIHCTENIFRNDYCTTIAKIDLSFEQWFDMIFRPERAVGINVDFTFPDNFIKLFPTKWYQNNPETFFQFCFEWMHSFVRLPQIDHIRPKDCPNHYADFIGRFETIEDDWKIVAERLNTDVKLPHRNRGVKKVDYKDYITNDIKAVIFDHYHEDFREFGYDW